MKCPHCDFDNPAESVYCGKCGGRVAPSPEAIDVTQPYPFPLMDLEVGTIFAGRYQVLEELGTGGMGKVYKVLDREIKEKIAIKILKPEISFDENIIERFRNELKLARKVTHPNVCRMHELIKEKGLYFITMEYVSGEDLKSTIARVGQLSVGKALAIAEQICKGLGEAHKLSVIHRDLKPHNIIIDRHGDVRIMDFGIAQTLLVKGITQSGVMIGTPEYMSPEQATGEGADQRSDIYSLGVILFELLTGTVPFKGDTAVGVALKQKTELPPNPQSLNPQISKEVSQLILRCLEKEKVNRYQNVYDLLEDINRIQKGFPTTDRLIPKKPPTKLEKKTKKWSFPSVNPVVLAIAFLAVAIGYGILKMGSGLFAKKIVQVIDTEILEEGRRFDLLAAKRKMEDVFYGAGETPDVVSGQGDETGTPSSRKWNSYISSDPQGALVYLNEENKGRPTPLKVLLPNGSYRIKIDHPDFLEETGEFQIEGGKIFQKRFVLKPAYIIDILSEPLGASVFIDGEPRGKTPQLRMKLAKQTSLLKLESLGFVPWTEELHLNLGPNLPKKIKLKALLVNIYIQTNPSQAMITIDDKPLGPSPQMLQIEAGVYTLKIEKEGYVPIIEEKKEFYQDFSRTFPLSPLGDAILEIRSYPKAEVYLDGNPLLEKGAILVSFTGIKKEKVKAGSHKIEFVFLESKKTLSTMITAETGKVYEVYAMYQNGKITVTQKK